MRRPVCVRCSRPQSHCLCPLIPYLPSRTRVLILQHPQEQRHALNTACLAALGLQNGELQVGERIDAALAEDLQDGRSWLLFPGEDAQPLASLAQLPQPQRLVVPDGSWRKARKLLHLNPALAALPRVCLPAGLVSRYRLRKAPAEGALSTIEAIVAALNMLEGEGRFDALLTPFEALIEGQIQAMGQEIYQRNHGAGRLSGETPGSDG